MDTKLTKRQLSLAGSIGLVAGALGLLAAGLLLAWPEQVAKGPVHYPFTVEGFTVAQIAFFLHHWGLVVALVALCLSGALGPGRAARAGGWLAVAGMLGLTFAELNTIRYAEWDFDTANAGLLGATYGVTTNLVGLGLLVAGVGAVRARVWSGWRRWLPLIIGIATFVELTPGMFGGFVIARLAIAVWMLLFALLGQGLRAESARLAPGA
jgi:hypothetical protein